MYDRSRNCHTLLLPTGKFAGAMVPPCGHRDQLEHFLDPRLNRGSSFAPEQQGKRDILHGRKPGNQMERLKNNPDGFPPDSRPIVAGKSTGRLPSKENLP